MADRRLFAKAAFMVVSASLFTVGCGDDVTKTTVNETTGIAQLAKGEAFPECASENTGEMLFAADSGAVYYCADGKWQTLNGKDGEAGENGDVCEEEILSDSSGYKILCAGDSVGVVLNGENGNSGENGESCTAETLENGSGYKILCGGDSVGIVLHGTKGDSGAPGANAENCTFSDDGYGSVTVTCETESVTLYKAICGTEPYDPGKSFCWNNGSKNEIVALCNGAAYDFSAKFCYDNGTTEEVVDRCNGATYDVLTHFCGNTGTKDTVAALCDGARFDFSTKFCYDNGTKEKVVDRCDGAAYDLSTHFCGNTSTKDTVVALCDGATYNLSTEFCADDKIYTTSEYSFVTTEYLNQTMLKNGNYGYLVDSRDNQVYRTVQIGTQTWMAQNLNYGSAQGTNFCAGNVAGNCATHGKLYMWSFAQSACPTGWRLPDTTEFSALITAAGGESIAGMKLKAETGWFDGEGESGGNGSNDYGFSAIPAGFRDDFGDFKKGGVSAYFLTSTESEAGDVYRLILSTDYDRAYLGNSTGKKSEAYSVRCLKE